ncbi:unnamed protein product, partial [Brenthis ino]
MVTKALMLELQNFCNCSMRNTIHCSKAPRYDAVVKLRRCGACCAGACLAVSVAVSPGAEGRPVVFTMHRRRVGRRRRREASRQAYQTAAGPAREPHSTLYR